MSLLQELDLGDADWADEAEQHPAPASGPVVPLEDL